MADKLTTIATFSTPPEASMAKATLEASGIRAYIQGSTTANMLWHVGSALGGVELQVSSADFSQAMKCLGLDDSSNSEKSIDAWTCRSCGEGVDAGFEVCWNCGTAFDENPQFEKSDDLLNLIEDDESAITCPMCGKGILQETEECQNCGERFDGQSFDDPAELDAEGELSEEARLTREALLRAYRASFYSLVLCPPLMTIYSVYLLAEYNRLRLEYGFPTEWRAKIAVGVNLLSLVFPFTMYWVY
jgi:hypothetical protein